MLQSFGIGGMVNGFGTTNPLDTDVGQPFWSESYSEAIQNWISEYENQIQTYPVMNQQVAETPTSIQYQQAYDPCADSENPDHCVSGLQGTTPALTSQMDDGGPIPSPTPSPVDCAGIQNAMLQAQTIMAQMQNTAQQLQVLQQQALQAGHEQEQQADEIADEASSELVKDLSLSTAMGFISHSELLSDLGNVFRSVTGIDPGDAETTQRAAETGEGFKKGYEAVEGAYNAWKGGTQTGQAISNGVSGAPDSSVTRQLVNAVQSIIVDPGLATTLGAKYLNEEIGPGMGALAKYDIAMASADLHAAESSVEYGTAASLQNAMDQMNQTYGNEWMLAGQDHQQLVDAQANGQCIGFDTQGMMSQ